ncbi:MAG: phospholipase D-like domain-containing protein [Bacteriovoracaceae bacterium]
MKTFRLGFLSLILTFISLKAYSFVSGIPAYNKGTCTPDDKFCVYFTPQDLPIEAVRAYLKSAKKSIRIATYNMSIADFADVLNEKAQTIPVEYMVDYKLSYGNKLWPKLDGEHPNISKFRIPVMRGGNPQMHNKLILIDDEILITGSANYSSMGLLANYENVIAIKEKSIIKKFRDEMNELRSLSKAVCEIFVKSTDPHICYKGPSNYDPQMHTYLTKGTFNDSALDFTDPKCKKLSKSASYRKRKALLDQTNNPTMKDISKCFKSDSMKQKIETLITKVSGIERYVDGTLTSTDRKFWKRPDVQSGQKYKVYFSPEDNLEARMLEVLNLPLSKPQDSFVYVSTNFITNYKLASALNKLKENGVRVRAFFDKGRFVDDMFSSQIPNLTKLGFFGDPNVINPHLEHLKGENSEKLRNRAIKKVEMRMSEAGLLFEEREKKQEIEREFNKSIAKFSNAHNPGDYRNVVTMFDNQLTGPYGCNHNKWAVVGVGDRLILLNGSANWSGGAMRINGENLMIMEDKVLSAIYLREMISELFVYRYGQNDRSPQFQDEISYLSSKAPCLGALLGTEDSCLVGNKRWSPPVATTAVVTVSGVPSDADNKNFYAKVFQYNNNRADFVHFYGSDHFNGKFIGALPMNTRWSNRLDFIFSIDYERKTSAGMYITPPTNLGIHYIPGVMNWY